MDLQKVRDIVDNVLRTKEYDEEFMNYHRNRNIFNVGKIDYLHAIGNNEFRDNFGNVWKEVSTLKNFFHMSKMNYTKSLLSFGLIKPFSRKFLRDDNGILKGEFEMIIRQDGKRIDEITHSTFQETYNFGRTRNTNEHYVLDVKPHSLDSKYRHARDMGNVKIFEQDS